MVETNFSAAHQLRGYKGSCERLHGHNWKVQVFLEGEELNEAGMLLDFKEIKKKADKLIEKLDHRYLNELPEFSKVNPTTENIARYIFGELSEEINNVEKVTVWESENSCASYSPQASRY
jgi:6-pyruvoyltetrahydropterin/6-carboxytetrahydropterin synthase